MVYERSLVFLVTGLAMVLSCFGFIAERSDNPVAWNAASSPETEGKVIHTSGMKTEVTGIDKGLQISQSDTKTSTETIGQTSPDATRKKKFGFILENVENRNVVLVVAETGQGSDDFWKNFRSSHSFSIDGLLQNCDSTDINTARFSMESALISGNKDKKCDCERFLGSNIVALLLWARDTKGMTTASLSNANFTIPTLFEYEESVTIQRESDEPDENSMKLEIRKIKPEVHGDWNAVDLGKPIHRASPLIPSSNNREDDETMWNVFDMFSKIRLALFRSLLESLGGNIATPDESISSYNPYIRRATLANIIGKLKSVESEKGFVLAVTVPANELNSVMELLQREVSEETLLVVTGVCSQDNQLVPFFAQGPADKVLRETKIIWDLPMTIGHAIASGCQGSSCRLRRHGALPLPVPQMNIVPHSIPTLKRPFRDATGKTNNGSKPGASISKDHEAKKVADLNSKEGAVKDNERDSNQKIRGAISTSNLTKAEIFTTVFGTLVSIFTTFTLAS
ncbi:uncharacterized protein LOC114880608 [Osmia bicornis bicornis]|uniref:uncharacterized protein LOC114880608 n=1 Tax=Osmia bicornis bicornis TaxID=1437191 RepID=UPI001EAEBD8A|nr:uncharacterized protein LOC114880608 [Osmia bicornis bicornis]